MLMPQLWYRPQVAINHCPEPATSVGIFRPVVVPSPSWP